MPKCVLFWLFITFARQVGRADERPVSLWRKLWQPHGDPARAARAFSLSSLTPLWSMTVIILGGDVGLDDSIAAPLVSLGLWLWLLAFGLVYLNHLPERTSFMVKLVAVTLALVLGTLGTVGYAITPILIARYHNPDFITGHKTLRFVPNDRDGYDVASVPFDFEDDLGTKLPLGNQQVSLDFDFPYYGRVWREAHLRLEGSVSFGEAINWYNVQYRYGPDPAIFALANNFVESDVLLEKPAGIYLHNTKEKLTITWYRLPELYSPENVHTFQLTLFPDGVFEITFDDLSSASNYDIRYSARNTARMIGAVPGAGENL